MALGLSRQASRTSARQVSLTAAEICCPEDGSVRGCSYSETHVIITAEDIDAVRWVAHPSVDNLLRRLLATSDILGRCPPLVTSLAHARERRGTIAPIVVQGAVPYHVLTMPLSRYRQL